MYSNQSFDEKVTTRTCNEDYDFCHTETGQKFIVQWSPQDGTRYLSRNRYASSRSLSKSVPRRTRGIVRYNINRSLNFDIGTRRRSDSFKSPNSSYESNPPNDGEHYLSRSAKILRALNIDYSPMKSPGNGIRKISKSLNFDLTPSPKRLVGLNKSGRSLSIRKFASPLSKINKTLNFETSSGESSVNSALDSSVESIDENQNRTPSQRKRKAKKSLNYRSPKFSPIEPRSLDVHSPMLRNDLREKIDNMIHTSITPYLQSSKRNRNSCRFDDFGASTPRNLFNDFHDDEEDDQNVERPRTPENVMKIVPESMSAIKKSHKKERVLGRLGKAIAYQTENCPVSESLTDMGMDVEPEEKRPTTPSNTSCQSDSPKCGLSSIKLSHKKDKSKRKSYSYNSEDEMSETGSIFDYTEEANAILSANKSPKIDKDPIDVKIRKLRDSQFLNEQNHEEDFHIVDKMLPTTVANVTASRHKIDSPEATRDADKFEIVQGPSTNITPSSSPRTTEDSVLTPPGKTVEKSPGPSTPENRINFLQRVMTDSIKKSHKKIKDANKRSLFKPRIVLDDAEEDTNNCSINEETTSNGDDRASTPENINSSRLLLSQFSSVKKSHRKDKHRRMLSGALERKKFYVRDSDTAVNSDCETHNLSLSSSIDDSSSLSPARNIDGAKRQKTSFNEFTSSENSSDANYQSLEDGPYETGIDKLPNFNTAKLTPNKRKNVMDDSSMSLIAKSPGKQESLSVEYESAEEEFKIFTPIKKRGASTLVTPIARRICENNDFMGEHEQLREEEGLMENETSTRCSTPAMPRNSKLIENSFKTPEASTSDIFISVTDYSTPILRGIENVGGDPSGGRSTPQNCSTAALMDDINSIKRSHKKDKRGNNSRRSLISAQEDEYEAEFTSGLENDFLNNSNTPDKSPRPSTSREIVSGSVENDTNVLAKTPPNCVRAKTYLRLLQTESIKRSHKKVRERRKYRSIVVDEALSDDGSIFDEAERSVGMENNEVTTDLENGDTENENFSQDVDCSGTSRYEERQFQGGTTSRFHGNLSDDGSIFELEDKLESPRKNANDTERGNTSSF